METGRLAVITARGGSKRIPGKNIREFCGRPILAYSIDAALQSGLFEEVMVSTDSEAIAEIAKKFGAAVPFMRSAKTADDFATTTDVLLEVLGEYQKRGRSFSTFACLYPTAPFITAQKLIEAVRLLEKNHVDAVMPMVPFSYPPQRSFVIDETGRAAYKYQEYAGSRSQDLEKWYHDAGQFYLYDAKRYLESEGKIEDLLPIIISELSVQDIDSEDDWKIAELKYRLVHRKISF